MGVLIIRHDWGFFSCCSVRLHEIIKFFNSNQRLALNIDCSRLYGWYKVNTNRDITFDYFEHYNKNFGINIKKNIDYHENYQYKNYSELDYTSLSPFIEKYFSPSTEIKNIIHDINIKYTLDYDNICVLFYRGNDKNTETTICNYQEYITKAKQILVENPNIVFLIQSDETEFIETIISLFPNNSFYFKDEIRHMNKCMSTVDKTMSNVP